MRACGRWLFVGIVAASALRAQERPVRWTLEPATTPLRARAGERIRVPVVARVDTGWKLYSLTQQSGGPIATAIALGEASPFTLDGEISAPTPESYPDRNFNVFTEIYTGTTRFVVPVRTHSSAVSGRHTLSVTVRFQTCTERYCLPPRTDTLTAAVVVAAPPTSTASSPERRDAVRSAATAPSAERGQPKVLTESPKGESGQPRTESGQPGGVSALGVAIVPPTDITSLLRFVWLAVTMGLLSLLTPCVLPMIPITVGYFGGREPSRGSHTRSALAHAFGIVAAFTGIGFAVAVFFGAGGMVRLAANPALNLLVAVLFIVFALNLFGAFEITIPRRILTGASRLGQHQKHTAGALLMGGAFAVTSFTCTVPFVGTLLVLATQGSWRWPLVGMAAYGAAFALPFFVLAVAPAAVERLPRSGAWMIGLKRTLAIAELALAVKFLSNADLVLGTRLLSRDVIVLLWILAAFAVAALWSTMTWRPQRGSTPRFRLAGAAIVICAASFGAWLARGVNGGRLGELEAYLPPRDGTADYALLAPRLGNGDELPWMVNNLDAALERSRTEGKPLLLDFTGYTCTNCRWMEANMFPKPDVRDRLQRYVRVRLFTDGLGEPYASQQRLQLERFGTVALPYYAVLNGRGEPVATFLGMTRDSREFSGFLDRALTGAR